MTRKYIVCEYPKCNRKAEGQYQAVGLTPGQLGEMFDLCFHHIVHGEKDTLRTMDKDKRKNKFREQMAQASIKKKDDSTQEAIKDHKDTLTLDNYKEKTGKRFRMTKDQKKRGLTREQAFSELMKGV